MRYRFELVENRDQINRFHDFCFTIYENFSQWCPPFRFEIEQIFDPQKNPFFEKGECERYLMFDGDSMVARFAVMNHPEKDSVYDPAMAGFGFVEFINDQHVVDEMIQFVKQWHKKRDYRAFRGPINFGENNNYWGLLVENFEEPPIYGMWFHPPYYKTLIEATGAEKLDDHWSYKMDFSDPIPERMIKITDRIENRQGVTYRQIGMKNLERDAEIIREIYNKAWSNQEIEGREEDFTELTRETVNKMIKNLKPVMIPESVILAFVNGNPASFVVCVPDLNEVSAQTGGRLRWWHIPKLYRLKKTAKHLRSIVYGTLPKYRKMGLEALTFVRGIQNTKKAVPSLDYFEGGWVSEKNWLMQRSLEGLGCRHHKTHRTYQWEIE